MLSKISHMLRRARDLPSAVNRVERRLDRMERIVFVTPLSPIDRHITLQTADRTDALYDITYPQWRTTRIAKLLEIYGIEHFKDLRILELGAGLCEIGAFFAELGAKVTCLEGRKEQVDIAKLKHRNIPNLRIEVCDLEGDFSNFGKFDLILHFGLLYHLKNVDENLRSCFGMADEIVLETVVCDSDDPHMLVTMPGRAEVIEESPHGHACRPSPAYVERLATEAGFSVERHFTSDLNASDGQFVYDWEPKYDGNLGDFHLRRFWRFRRKTASE
jgi:protein-L-isoaspartate O-methyltransferase